MDASRKVVESFDFLWVFNNVLTMTTFQQKILPPAAASIDDDQSVKEEREEEEKFKDKTLNLQIVEVCRAGILDPIWCPNCGEIAVEIERPVKEEKIVKPTEKEQRSKRRRRRRKRSKRKILGELDLGFHGDQLVSQSFLYEEITYGCDQSFESIETQHYRKMPPLNDGLAMKEHLKSWAYAVACTVR